MAETQFGIIEATPSLPARNLLRVPHKGEVLVVSSPAFGPNTYLGNLEEMRKDYSHSKELPKISFKVPTTTESISAVAYDFENLAKLQIFDPRWLQAGRIVRTLEGVWANPPTDEQGSLITDERELKTFLDKCTEVKGIRLYQGENHNLRDFGYAPYETFETGVQDCDTFAEGGLARLLEHTEEQAAENLRAIASPKHYKKGVNVCSFGPVGEPVLRVVTLYSVRDVRGSRLLVGGCNRGDDCDGFAFGVLDSAEGSAPKN